MGRYKRTAIDRVRQSGSSVMLNDTIHSDGSHDDYSAIGSVTSDGFEVLMLTIFTSEARLVPSIRPCPHLLPRPLPPV